MSNNIFFTADTHFNHQGILIHRPQYTSLDEMNNSIITRWNSRVKKGDRVYHLGDFALGHPKSAANILDNLNGQIYLILGNHDSVAQNNTVKHKFLWQKDFYYGDFNGQKIALSHYAMRTWRSSHKGSWQLYGHSHGSLSELPYLKSFDVGVDCWSFYPVSFEEISEKMKGKLWEQVDHHAKEQQLEPWELG